MDQDSELLDASRQAVDAFAVLYDRNYRSVLGYFYRRIGCPETAADLATETFAAAFSSRRNFRPTGAPKTSCATSGIVSPSFHPRRRWRSN